MTRTFIEVVNHQTMMPNQITARTISGEFIYVRARHGWLSFYIAPTEEQTFDDEFLVYEEGHEGSGLGYESYEEFSNRFERIIVEQNLGVIGE
jgi:hypothetical protein